ncbi:MAG: hypothetical protein DRP11_04660 [Candidatus Aenigmatarchaeota archaeon]|nr:MAG: hypothetical protein DRP11_04660 [Candidatus Aenigmarchaeota archaeon]
MTKTCPQCGKQMIKRYENRVLLTNPPQYPWYWWCECGYTEKGGADRGILMEDFYYQQWEEVNKG